MSLERLREDLVELGRFGRKKTEIVDNYDDLGPEKGVTRVTGSESDKKARDFLVKRMKDSGLEVEVDGVGNIFGVKDGNGSERKSVMLGSHIDSVVDGGMFDGALGLVSALEAVRRLEEEDFENERPLEIVVYTGEEASAFPVPLLGSSVLTGKMSVNEALGVENDKGDTLREALENIGYRGDFEKSLDDVKYALEMHVEQGPLLDDEDIPVGIVENITGATLITATIKGVGDHAGTTPMDKRKDALVGAAEIISFVNKRACELSEENEGSTVGTVGKLNVFPNGFNIVPREVEMGVDIRDVAKDNLEILVDETFEAFGSLKDRHGLNVTTELKYKHKPIALSSEVMDAVEESCEEIGVKAKKMNSGAGHDSQNVAEKVRTGMIFVPSVDGISHAPMEWTDWEDIEKGTKVLTETVKKLLKK